MKHRSNPVLRRSVLALLAAACSSAFSQTNPNISAKLKTVSPRETAQWPTQPIKLIVGFPPGSVQDISARIIAEPLSKSLGQPVIVENKEGASGSIAAAFVAKATDQHTFGVMNNSQLTIAKMLNPAIAYDPATDLSPIALIATTPLVLVVTTSAVGSNPMQWLAWLSGQGDKANYGSPGVGTPGHLGMELIKSKSGGLSTRHIPYPGNPQVINAILSGQIQAALLPPGLALQQVRSGKLHAIGVTTEHRSLLAPELPTLRESSVVGVDIELFTAVAGPATASQAVQEKLSLAVVAAVKSAETRQKLINSGWQPSPSIAEGLRSKVRAENMRLGGIIILRNIRMEG